MASKRCLLLFIFLYVTTNFAFVISQYESFACSPSNYTSKSKYRDDIKTLLGSLSSNMGNRGFYHTSFGKANAIALCKADIPLEFCRSRIHIVAREILGNCPRQYGAVMWSENCMVRYSNIFGILAFNPRRIPPINETHNIREPQPFKQVRKKLLDDLRDQAVNGGARRKVAAGNRTATANQTIYAMVQCTPDLSPENCAKCLVEAAKNISDSCDNLPECRIYLTSCSLRYDDKNFYNITRIQEPLEPSSPPLSPRPSSPPPAGNDNDHGTRNIIIIVVSAVVFLAVASCVSIFVWKKIGENPNRDPNTGDGISTDQSIQYHFGEIRAATNYFSDANKLGQGGFGAVYKGILQNGREIAVKRLSKDSGQGVLEFQNEALLVARLQHRNLVRLFGFSIEGTERLLIYEFVQNGSLDRFIFDLNKSSNLDWGKRYKIIMGVARGLVYLHEDSRLRIVHRDLKASNVLLDEEMNPKISDFGLAKLVVPEATHESTSRIIGTYGYMAPEYAIHGYFSIKSDVYSFGVVVLEIVSGQKIIQNGQNSGDLVSKAWKSWRKGTIANMIDPVLMATSSGAQQDMLRCIHIALLCVQENKDDRPTMASVVLMLNSFSLALPLPSERQFYVSSISSDASLSQMEASTSSNSPSTQPLCSSGNDSVNHCH